jgi:hypothetical protein
VIDWGSLWLLESALLTLQLSGLLVLLDFLNGFNLDVIVKIASYSLLSAAGAAVILLSCCFNDEFEFRLLG